MWGFDGPDDEPPLYNQYMDFMFKTNNWIKEWVAPWEQFNHFEELLRKTEKLYLSYFGFYFV